MGLHWLDGGSMHSMWNPYDKLSVEIVSYIMEVAYECQNFELALLWFPNQWAFKHSLACHKFSLVYYHVPPGHLTLSILSMAIYTCSNYLRELTRGLAKYLKIASSSSQLEL